MHENVSIVVRGVRTAVFHPQKSFNDAKPRECVFSRVQPCRNSLDHLAKHKQLFVQRESTFELHPARGVEICRPEYEHSGFLHGEWR